MKKGPLSWSGETRVPVSSRGSRTPGAHDGVSPVREKVVFSLGRERLTLSPDRERLTLCPDQETEQVSPDRERGPFFNQNPFENAKPIGKRLIQIMFESCARKMGAVSLFLVLSPEKDPISP